MKQYAGMRFQDWCRLDTEDTRKIHYTVNCIRNRQEQTIKFTSDDFIDSVLFTRIVNGGIIEKVSMRKDEWYITLYC